MDLKWGEAFIFRTIAGHPQPIFQDLVVLDAVSHGFDEIIIMYHTGKHDTTIREGTSADSIADCGAHRFNDDFIRSELGKTDGKDQVPALKLPTLEERFVTAHIFTSATLADFHHSAEQSIRNDLAWMRSQPLLRTELAGKLKGYIYDLHSGEVRAVEDA